MKTSKQNRIDTFFKGHQNIENFFLRIASKTLSSSWGLGALIGAISAWTAGILYV